MCLVDRLQCQDMTIVPLALLTALLTHRYSNKPIRDKYRLLPMQHDLAIKVSSNLDRHDSWYNRRLNIVQQLYISRLVRCLTQPMSVIRGDIDGTIEGPGPGCVCGVVVRVGYHDSFQSALVLDLREGDVLSQDRFSSCHRTTT